MSKKKIFFTLTGYQLTWMACVFSEKQFSKDILGVIVGILFLLLYFYYSKNKLKFIKISLLIAIPGYVFDSALVFFSIYEFNTPLIFGYLPLWMIVLWLSFSTLFDEILIFLKNYTLPGVILSCFLGPLTYYLGKPIGIITIYNLSLFFFLMTLFWAMLMFYYLKFVLKN